MTNIYPGRGVLAVALFLAVSAGAVSAQTDATPRVPQTESAKVAAVIKPTAAPAKKVVQPTLKAIREVELGMTMDQVKQKLGKPEVEDLTGMYFSLAGGDSVQIGIDDDKKVRTIASIYAPGSKAAPSMQDVLGADANTTDGDVYKMIRYPEADYWVSYSRTNSKDKPQVIVTMRRID